MLPREKKRSAASLAIGLLLGLCYFAWNYADAASTDRSIALLVDQCQKESRAKVPAGLSPEDQAFINRYFCGPFRLSNLGNYDLSKLTPLQDQIWRLQIRADHDRGQSRFGAVLIFLISCVPLLWYLFLDRIRDLSAAISGRDRIH